jgi:SAM-dependent methyltransferase
MGEADRACVGAIPELYDRYMGPMLFEPYAQDLASRFAGFEGALLETAAGTGRVTPALAQAAPRARIVATDLNPPMRERAAPEVKSDHIQWRQADAQALPFEDAAFDAVICQFGVMFFPDKAAGYAEALRVLRRGGRFVLSVRDALGANDISQAVCDAIAARFPDDPPAFFVRTPFGYNDRAAIEAALKAAGFGPVRIETVTLPTPSASVRDAAVGLCLGTPLRGEIEARDPAALDEVVDTVTEALERRFGKGAISGQGQALVVTAEKP